MKRISSRQVVISLLAVVVLLLSSTVPSTGLELEYTLKSYNTLSFSPLGIHAIHSKS